LNREQTLQEGITDKYVHLFIIAPKQMHFKKIDFSALMYLDIIIYNATAHVSMIKFPVSKIVPTLSL